MNCKDGVIQTLAMCPHLTSRCISVCLSGDNLPTWKICYKFKWNTVSTALSTGLEQNVLSKWELLSLGLVIIKGLFY